MSVFPLDFHAAILEAPHDRLKVETVTVDRIGPDDVLVKVEASGLCSSDLRPIAGAGLAWGWPLVLGHEVVGTVEACGERVSSLAVGDTVVATALASCGTCAWCRQGRVHLCDSALSASPPRFHRAGGQDVYAMNGLGGFAEYVVASRKSLVRVASELPFEQLALVGCAVTTGLGAVVNTAQVEPGASVVVIGLGPVGQSVIQGARIAGAASIIGVDPLEHRRSTAVQLGADAVLDPTATDVVQAIRDATDQGGADHVFEVTGREPVVNDALGAVIRGGTLTLVGAPSPIARTDWPALDIVFSEKRVQGCLYGSTNPARDFQRCIDLVEAGRMDLASMVSNLITLDDVPDAIETMAAGNGVRTVMVPR
ncbi:alcohol dehydrogenase catalytic domain-containing protein [Rhodococcus opacus]|nr:alcohol dehydrogenase catalytic domain-containing protein [Rhodococcus opacus]